MSYQTDLLDNSRLCLTYDDLCNGGALAKSVKDFTFFPDVSCCNAFLDLINFTEGCKPWNRLYESMVRYSSVSICRGSPRRQ